MDYSIILYLTFGLLPSLVWLLYYLREDTHPEPKKFIIKIFFTGVLITIPTLFFESVFYFLLLKTHINFFLFNFLYHFLIISFIEEFFKFLVVYIKVLKSPHLDEPIDFIIYMVTSALGFATVENLLFLLPSPGSSFNSLNVMGKMILITIIRFIGGTFLHTLCSALIGYALAISYCDEKNRFLEASSGFTIAVFLHGLYNFSIINLEGWLKVLIPFLILLNLSFFVFKGIEKIKKLKSITILNYERKTKA